MYIESIERVWYWLFHSLQKNPLELKCHGNRKWQSSKAVTACNRGQCTHWFRTETEENAEVSNHWTVFFVSWMEYSILSWKDAFIKVLVTEGKWWMNWYCLVISTETGCVLGDVCSACSDDGSATPCKLSQSSLTYLVINWYEIDWQLPSNWSFNDNN